MSQTALLALQPPSLRLICQVTNMPVHVAGSVQPSRERWDSRGHAFAPSVSRGNRARRWPGKIRQTQRFLQQESFIARRRVRSDLVLTTVPESQRKLVPRNTATFARSMGVHTQRTILAIAVVSRKTERKIQFPRR